MPRWCFEKSQPIHDAYPALIPVMKFWQYSFEIQTSCMPGKRREFRIIQEVIVMRDHLFRKSGINRDRLLKLEGISVKLPSPSEPMQDCTIPTGCRYPAVSHLRMPAATPGTRSVPAEQYPDDNAPMHETGLPVSPSYTLLLPEASFHNSGGISLKYPGTAIFRIRIGCNLERVEQDCGAVHPVKRPRLSHGQVY